jgi:hypothetical protein
MSRILKISQGDYKVQASSTNSIIFEAGSVVVSGDLNILGAATYITTTDTTVSDNILVLNKGEVSNGISPRNSLRTSGIEIDRGKDGVILLSSRFIFDESTSHYDPTSNSDINGTFLLQTTRGSSTILGSLQLSSLEVTGISCNTANNNGIVFNLKNTQATVSIANSTYNSTPYESRITDNDLTTKKYVTTYVTSGITTQGISASGTIAFNTTTHNQLFSTAGIGAGTITITSGTTGAIDNLAIGTTTPSTGKFTKLITTTSMTVPVGNSGARPNDATAGNIRYNTQLRSFEGYNGTLWGLVGGGLQSSIGIATANYNALANNLVRADSTGGSFSIFLPDSPNDGDVVGVIDISNTFNTNPVTLVPNSGTTIESDTSLILDLDGSFSTVVYVSAVSNWKLQETPLGPVSGSNGLTSINGRIITRNTTTDSTPTVLTTDSSTASSTNQLILRNDSTQTFSILVSARRTDADNESAGFKFEGVIDRNANAASTAFVGTPVKNVLGKDTTAWDCNISIDTTNGGLSITVLGETSKIIKWVAICNYVEVTG